MKRFSIYFGMFQLSVMLLVLLCYLIVSFIMWDFSNICKEVTWFSFRLYLLISFIPVYFMSEIVDPFYLKK